jgi:hypothetical protein
LAGAAAALIAQFLKEEAVRLSEKGGTDGLPRTIQSTVMKHVWVCGDFEGLVIVQDALKHSQSEVETSFVVFKDKLALDTKGVLDQLQAEVSDCVLISLTASTAISGR